MSVALRRMGKAQRAHQHGLLSGTLAAFASPNLHRIASMARPPSAGGSLRFLRWSRIGTYSAVSGFAVWPVFGLRWAASSSVTPSITTGIS